MSLQKIEEAIEKVAFGGTTVGAVVGGFRKKDKDESRGRSILRSAGTGAGVDAGLVAGTLASRALRGGHLILPVLGGIGGYELAKRKDKKK